MRSWLLAILTLLVGLGVVPAAASADPGSRADTGPIRPVRACAELVRDFAIPGAATHVTAATVVPAGAEPEHCDVRGFVEPAVNFQLRLPTASYRGRYLQYGCGGFCGLIFPTPFRDCGPRVGDFAVAATDDGHVGEGPFPPSDARWAANDQAARDDFNFRAPHVVSVASKRIIAEFYGKPPVASYFDGCSDGGREALLLAQRYPTDFDGVIAGAPAGMWSPLLLYQAWIARANTDAAGGPVITAAKLPALSAAVLAACDGVDGLTDGQIDDPRGCRFDPATIRCAGADAPTCLTPAQVDAARKLYAGPTDARGTRLYPGAQPFGSELAWDGWIIANPLFGPEPAATGLADNYLRYLGYPIGTPHSSLAEVRFSTGELLRLTPEGVDANAMGLDLSAFRRAGGKVILWHGWADQGIPPAGTVDYWDRLVDRNGGLRDTQRFARLFMVPAVFHCAGGTTLTEFDPLRELVDWVELGRAPERVIATGRDAAGNVTRTRPVFPYPLRAAYDGSGSIDDAANFVPSRPARSDDRIRWAGEFLYRLPGPVAG
ncbi:MAG TPA: tannase/feruloyl esterase family alpha/beta hydrolase [Actinophytocola sp.]|uniref:tannase/feruloyl esterase family alpha/beta hydrolase n=1 Tax=Actinophytocola sp. TaxID=1872138 RepID=UPI002DBCA972|nr:tannase/feruloyl esterase family alpha/beta hydrolase [Actinophytocola sp.]HEU5475382.1 tannase/feruloyl esterase family alpha/beta hydrolase [Actinophytocola sp.]